jgi:hypothetical protein
VPVEHTDQIREIFDRVSYSKGMFAWTVYVALCVSGTHSCYCHWENHKAHLSCFFFAWVLLHQRIVCNPLQDWLLLSDESKSFVWRTLIQQLFNNIFLNAVHMCKQTDREVDEQ